MRTTYTPLKAIRKKCINCSGFSCKEVTNCDFTDCSLYPYRFGLRPETALKQGKEVKCDNIKTPLKAIRSECISCMNGSKKEVKLCSLPNCSLYPYRFGMRPSTAVCKGKKV